MVRLSEPNNALKPAWILGFWISNVVLFPALFPGLVFGTPSNTLFFGVVTTILVGKGRRGFSQVPHPLPSHLRLGVGNRLPLHVARCISPVTGNRDDVVDHVALAGAFG